jgi:hypothetical protein
MCIILAANQNPLSLQLLIIARNSKTGAPRGPRLSLLLSLVAFSLFLPPSSSDNTADVERYYVSGKI